MKEKKNSLLAWDLQVLCGWLMLRQRGTGCTYKQSRSVVPSRLAL